MINSHSIVFGDLWPRLAHWPEVFDKNQVMKCFTWLNNWGSLGPEDRGKERGHVLSAPGRIQYSDENESVLQMSATF